MFVRSVFTGYAQPVDPHQLAEARSLAYHRAVAELLGRDSTVLTRARARVDSWLATGQTHKEYASAWRELLASPLATLREAIVTDDERMRTLRSVTPFAGAIDPRTRWRIWREVRGMSASMPTLDDDGTELRERRFLPYRR